MPPNQSYNSGNNVYPTPERGPMASFDPSQPLPKRKRHISALLVPFILTLIFLIAALGYGFWATMSREDYKNNSDQKSAEAVKKAEAALSAKKDAEFTEREKEPLKEYKGPATFGSLFIKYPKTWGAFITEQSNSSIPIDGYMHPSFVPGIQSGTAFALHFQVTNVSYDQELKKFDSAVKQGKVQVAPTTAPKVPDIAGVRVTGEIATGKRGTQVMFPLRDKTLIITTESEQFNQDFNNIILANLTFSP